MRHVLPILLLLVGCSSRELGSSCRSNQDCTTDTPLSCVAPGTALCGGPARVCTACSSDAACQASDGGAGMVCDVATCGCSGVKICVPGCTSSSDCLSGSMCSATHHCVPIPCGSCPAHFVCGSSGACERQRCASDRDCGSGFCVEGACYQSAGTCMPVPL